jgi:hypothetical protein
VWSKKQLNCPQCREPFVSGGAAGTTLPSNGFAAAMVYQAPIVCPKRAETGCTWRSKSMGTQGRLLIAHEKETCAAFMATQPLQAAAAAAKP